MQVNILQHIVLFKPVLCMFNMFWIYFGYVKKLFIFCEMPFYAKLHIYIIALNILSKINSVVNLNVPDVEE